MKTSELIELSKNWIAYWRAKENSAERDDLFWVMEREWDLVREHPFQALQMVFEVLKLDSSNEIQEVLSAGPLEDLLAKHGAEIIDSIETEAKNNPLFATLLGGVWKNSMSEDIWARVQKVWNRTGWDGN